jgi:hypothetical protein
MANQTLTPPICTDSAQWRMAMAFIADKEELKPGLIIFRRGDVAHSHFYCRIKLPKADRYKTIALARIIHPVEFGALSFKHLASSEHT